MKRVNVNSAVKIKATDMVLALLYADHIEYWSSYGLHGQATAQEESIARKMIENYTPPKVDENGFISMQLWDVMNKLGHHFILGMEVPFIEIFIEEKNIL